MKETIKLKPSISNYEEFIKEAESAMSLSRELENVACKLQESLAKLASIELKVEVSQQ